VVWLDAARWHEVAVGLRPFARVVEAQDLVGPYGSAERQQHGAVDLFLRTRGAPLDHRHLHGVDTVPQPGGQHLAHRGQRPRGGVADIRARAGRELQCDRHCHGLIVIEQQWRHLGTGFEPVTAVRPFHRDDGVAELTQPIDVTAHRTRRDIEPFGEQMAGPVTPRLQQRQKGEQPA
jgi:hypothetical protein